MEDLEIDLLIQSYNTRLSSVMAELVLKDAVIKSLEKKIVSLAGESKEKNKSNFE